jgi:hypothetical protein
MRRASATATLSNTLPEVERIVHIISGRITRTQRCQAHRCSISARIELVS